MAVGSQARRDIGDPPDGSGGSRRGRRHLTGVGGTTGWPHTRTPPAAGEAASQAVGPLLGTFSLPGARPHGGPAHLDGADGMPASGAGLAWLRPGPRASTARWCQKRWTRFLAWLWALAGDGEVTPRAGKLGPLGHLTLKLTLPTPRALPLLASLSSLGCPCPVLPLSSRLVSHLPGLGGVPAPPGVCPWPPALPTPISPAPEGPPPSQFVHEAGTSCRAVFCAVSHMLGWPWYDHAASGSASVPRASVTFVKRFWVTWQSCGLK